MNNRHYSASTPDPTAYAPHLNKVNKVNKGNQGNQGNKEKEGEGVCPPISLLIKQVDAERARASEPLVVSQGYRCRWCNVTYQHGLTKAWQQIDMDYEWAPGVRRGDFQICDACFCKLLLQGTLQGRQAVEFAIKCALPEGSGTTMDFGQFKCYGRYAQHLREVCQKVVTWTQQADRDIGQTGNLYLYSTLGPHGPGNGNGKTSLMYASYRYLARRSAWFRAGRINLSNVVISGCHVLSVEQLVDEFRKERRQSEEREPITLTSKVSGQELSFDQCRAEIAEQPVLFMDDVGCRKATRMEQETYEIIFDSRAGNNLPTFVTSNYHPGELARQIGGRAASRLFRNQPTIVEVRAPDYPTQQALTRQGGVK